MDYIVHPEKSNTLYLLLRMGPIRLHSKFLYCPLLLSEPRDSRVQVLENEIGYRASLKISVMSK